MPRSFDGPRGALSIPASLECQHTLARGSLAALDPATNEDQFGRARRWLETEIRSPVAVAQTRGQWAPVGHLQMQAVWWHYAAARSDCTARAELFTATAAECNDPLRAIGYQSIL